MKFEEVEMIRTKDGSLFESSELARAHVVDQVSAEINELLKPAFGPNVGFSQVYKLVDCISGDVEKIEKLKAILDKHI